MLPSLGFCIAINNLINMVIIDYHGYLGYLQVCTIKFESFSYSTEQMQLQWRERSASQVSTDNATYLFLCQDLAQVGKKGLLRGGDYQYTCFASISNIYISSDLC